MKTICLSCKGRLWCGMKKCPILEVMKTRMKFKTRITSPELFGSTPPSNFIGRFGYPKVNVGILLPPETGDTRIYDSPTKWFKTGMSIEKILGYRASLINSRRKFSVRTASDPNRFLETIQEVAMSSSPVDTEVKLFKIPKISVNFPFNAIPFGPSASVKRVKLAENPRIKRRVDYVCSDSDLKASRGVVDLYEHKIDVYHISKILSVGLLGLKKQRRLVPTRWSITASDSIIADNLLEQVKHYPEISEYLLFESNYIGNYFEVLLLPTEWMFEQVEMGVPGGMWTQNMKKPIIISDHEFYWGRKIYAKEVAGAYYAAKLAVLEYLTRIKRQAGVLVVREIRPEYFSEVGVWKIRECVRDAMERKPLKFSTLIEVIKRINQVLMIKHNVWSKKSKIMDRLIHQRKIREFFNDTRKIS